MKRMLSLCAAALCLTLALTPTALAADFEPAVPNAKVCYPTAIVRGDDGTELKKIYDLSPEDDPAGIPPLGLPSGRLPVHLDGPSEAGASGK